MKLFIFYQSDSWLHRLNPLTKLAFAGLLMLMVTVIVDPITPFLAATLTLLAILALGRIRWRDLIGALAPFGVIAFGLFWTTTLFYAPGPTGHLRTVASLGPVMISDEAIAYGLAITFRILAVFVASLLFVLTTDPTDFVQSLIQVLRLNYRFGYGALAAYRFVPLFDSELSTIRAAHRIRGVGSGGGPLGWYREIVTMMVPLLAGGIRRAERVALAMDARGFGAAVGRTYYRQATLGRQDVVFGVGASLIIASSLLGLHQLGWLAQLVPPFLAAPRGG
jgi:energy-coupling factor transport system permease protein